MWWPRHRAWFLLSLVPVFVVLIALTSYPLLHHGWGFDRVTSYYAAMPGGLQDMLIYGEEAGADVRVLSLIHDTRVLALVCLAPVVLHRFWGVDLHALPGQPAREIPLDEILLMIGARNSRAGRLPPGSACSIPRFSGR